MLLKAFAFFRADWDTRSASDLLKQKTSVSFGHPDGHFSSHSLCIQFYPQCTKTGQQTQEQAVPSLYEVIKNQKDVRHDRSHKRSVQTNNLLVKPTRKLWLGRVFLEEKENNSLLQTLAENIGCRKDYFLDLMMMSTAVKIRPLPFSNVKALNSVLQHS